ncbi:MAG: hypothetical protein ABIP48_11125 [Planctomycetota bacterium]
MNHRQRVQAALRFERPDRLPCNESLWDGTLEAWQEQGMPAGTSAAEYFDFDLCFMAMDASSCQTTPQRAVNAQTSGPRGGR